MLTLTNTLSGEGTREFDTMTRLMDVDQPELSIVFGHCTKRRVDELTRGLKLRGFRAEGIHGDLDQTNVFVLSVTSRTTKSISWLRQTLQRVVLTFQVSSRLQLRYSTR
ncbi:MAG: hypothetical protein ACLS5G_02005 [Streptococcus sp.]